MKTFILNGNNTLSEKVYNFCKLYGANASISEIESQIKACANREFIVVIRKLSGLVTCESVRKQDKLWLNKVSNTVRNNHVLIIQHKDINELERSQVLEWRECIDKRERMRDMLSVPSPNFSKVERFQIFEDGKQERPCHKGKKYGFYRTGHNNERMKSKEHTWISKADRSKIEA